MSLPKWIIANIFYFINHTKNVRCTRLAWKTITFNFNSSIGVNFPSIYLLHSLGIIITTLIVIDVPFIIIIIVSKLRSFDFQVKKVKLYANDMPLNCEKIFGKYSLLFSLVKLLSKITSAELAKLSASLCNSPNNLDCKINT